jgi:hypothetical protein
MSTLKNVGNKLFKVELENHNVELATIYDDLKGTLAEANKEVIKALELKNQAAKLADISLKKNRDLIKELDKAERLIKDLGLDSELTKVQKAKAEVSGNINAIDTIINRLLSV